MRPWICGASEFFRLMHPGCRWQAAAGPRTALVTTGITPIGARNGAENAIAVWRIETTPEPNAGP